MKEKKIVERKEGIKGIKKIEEKGGWQIFGKKNKK